MFLFAWILLSKDLNLFFFHESTSRILITVLFLPPLSSDVHGGGGGGGGGHLPGVVVPQRRPRMRMVCRPPARVEQQRVQVVGHAPLVGRQLAQDVAHVLGDLHPETTTRERGETRTESILRNSQYLWQDFLPVSTTTRTILNAHCVQVRYAIQDEL